MAPKITDQDKIDFLVLYINSGNDLKKVREELGNMPRQTAEARLKAIKSESEKRRAGGETQPAAGKKGGKGKASSTATDKPAAKKRKRATKGSEDEADGEV